MADEIEINRLQEELKRVRNLHRQSRRRRIIGLLVTFIVISGSILYSYFQWIRAERNLEEAMIQKDLADRYHVEAAENREEARQQEALAKGQRARADYIMEELAKCKGKK